MRIVATIARYLLGDRFHCLWFERFSALYSTAAAAIGVGRSVFHGDVHIALPSICFSCCN